MACVASRCARSTPQLLTVARPSVDGEADPWRAQGITQEPECASCTVAGGCPTLVVAGASHHAWTHPAAPTDQPSVGAARVAIGAQVALWLAEVDPALNDDDAAAAGGGGDDDGDGGGDLEW